MANVSSPGISKPPNTGVSFPARQAWIHQTEYLLWSTPGKSETPPSLIFLIQDGTGVLILERRQRDRGKSLGEREGADGREVR